MRSSNYLKTLQVMRAQLSFSIEQTEHELASLIELRDKIEAKLTAGGVVGDRSRSTGSTSVRNTTTLARSIVAELEKPRPIKSFTISDLETWMLESGYMFRGQKPRAQLAMQVKKLFDSGQLTLVERGLGSKPHIYSYPTPDFP
ncbi:hypothetical protein ACM7MI_28495 [Pseudomonas aeruginosa]